MDSNTLIASLQQAVPGAQVEGAPSVDLQTTIHVSHDDLPAIARVLRKAGYAPVHRKGRPVGDEHPRRFEAPHRNSLWQLDFTELRVGSERRWLLVIEDDFSRFVVGHVLAEGPTSEVVVAAMREASRLHGKPERVYTDRGAAFTAWRDVTSCEQFLDEQLIELLQKGIVGRMRPQRPLLMERALVSGVTSIVADYLISGETHMLAELEPQLVQLMLMPYEEPISVE